jgi:hypothetical protein
LETRTNELLARKSSERSSPAVQEAANKLFEEKSAIESELRKTMFDLRERSGMDSFGLKKTTSTVRKLRQLYHGATGLTESDMDKLLCKIGGARETAKVFDEVRQTLSDVGERILSTRYRRGRSI